MDEYIGYVRVSTEEQATNTSLENQKQKLKEWAKANCIKLSKIYSDVISGSSGKRPGLFKAMQHLKQSAAGVAVWKLDRFSRNVRHFLSLLDSLTKRGKRLVSLDFPHKLNSAVGRLTATIMVAVGEHEIQLIKERTQAGRQAKAAAKGYAYGAPAYGKKALDNQLVIDAQESANIARARKLHREGRSYQDIADHFNRLKIPTKRKGKWSKSQVWRIINR